MDPGQRSLSARSLVVDAAGRASGITTVEKSPAGADQRGKSWEETPERAVTAQAATITGRSVTPIA
jgi:hypothetical protein